MRLMTRQSQRVARSLSTYGHTKVDSLGSVKALSYGVNPSNHRNLPHEKYLLFGHNPQRIWRDCSPQYETHVACNGKGATGILACNATECNRLRYQSGVVLMLKFIAHDTINDIAIIQTSFGFNVRYGLQYTLFNDIERAIKEFHDCQRHAINTETL